LRRAALFGCSYKQTRNFQESTEAPRLPRWRIRRPGSASCAHRKKLNLFRVLAAASIAAAAKSDFI
jgi:hypothetical protein